MLSFPGGRHMCLRINDLHQMDGVGQSALVRKPDELDYLAATSAWMELFISPNPTLAILILLHCWAL